MRKYTESPLMSTHNWWDRSLLAACRLRVCCNVNVVIGWCSAKMDHQWTIDDVT